MASILLQLHHGHWHHIFEFRTYKCTNQAKYMDTRLINRNRFFLFLTQVSVYHADCHKQSLRSIRFQNLKHLNEPINHSSSVILSYFMSLEIVLFFILLLFEIDNFLLFFFNLRYLKLEPMTYLIIRSRVNSFKTDLCKSLGDYRA